jgi:hypothetical protein
MRKPDEHAVAGLKLILSFIEKGSCVDFRKVPCEMYLSDECFGCIEIENAKEWIQKAVAETESEAKGN